MVYYVLVPPVNRQYISNTFLLTLFSYRLEKLGVKCDDVYIDTTWRHTAAVLHAARLVHYVAWGSLSHIQHVMRQVIRI